MWTFIYLLMLGDRNLILCCCFLVSKNFPSTISDASPYLVEDILERLDV